MLKIANCGRVVREDGRVGEEVLRGRERALILNMFEGDQVHECEGEHPLGRIRLARLSHVIISKRPPKFVVLHPTPAE